ncbi:MAG: GDP-L-fucose synthase [Planctomycetales bacterium]|nr:GDP-L-fucose synthase [Planctomycetales bacterium]
MTSHAKIFVSGHRGLVGSAVVRQLQRQGFTNVVTATRQELDLRDPQAVRQWFKDHRPEFVIHVAGKVGGINANATEPADFIYDNLMIHATVLRASYECDVRKLLYLGSSCIYPRDCPQPIKEEYLLTGPLEATNRAYAVAKIAGLVSCEAYRTQFGCRFISAMPTNLYGPHDNFDLVSSHVLPALIRKFDDARRAQQSTVTVWGTGQPRREFLFVDDLAEACLFLMQNYEGPDTINVGTGEDVMIAELADTVRQIVYPGSEIRYDRTKPDGTPRKLLDVSRLHKLGWAHRTPLMEGIRMTYQWFLEHASQHQRR